MTDAVSDDDVDIASVGGATDIAMNVTVKRLHVVEKSHFVSSSTNSHVLLLLRALHQHLQLPVKPQRLP